MLCDSDSLDKLFNLLNKCMHFLLDIEFVLGQHRQRPVKPTQNTKSLETKTLNVGNGLAENMNYGICDSYITIDSSDNVVPFKTSIFTKLFINSTIIQQAKVHTQKARQDLHFLPFVYA